MNAKKCDRCGAFYEPYRQYIKVQGNNRRVCAITYASQDSPYRDYNTQLVCDLCNDCMKELINWFEMKGE